MIVYYSRSQALKKYFYKQQGQLIFSRIWNAYNPVSSFLLKLNNRNTRTICSKLKAKTLEWRHLRRSSIFIVKFEQNTLSWCFHCSLWTIKWYRCWLGLWHFSRCYKNRTKNTWNYIFIYIKTEFPNYFLFSSLWKIFLPKRYGTISLINGT